MKKVSLYTLGCKVNQYETEAIAELFAQSGYEICDFGEKADVYVINTCSVTNMSDRKSRQIIRRAVKANPNAVIAVTGCYAQTAPNELLDMEGVNIVIGTKDRRNIVDIVEKYGANSHVNLVSNIMDNHDFEKLHISTYSGRTRAYIKVQEGCSQFCSYCVIPYARGPVRSRPLDDITNEIKTLAANNFKEIILVGIHVASYGADLSGASLEKLINEANAVDGIERIRLSSIEPMTLNSEFIEKIKNAEKLCPHFHISLQSGCDETLKRMNRHYTAEQFKDIADALRDTFKDAAVTTDIMVGFPGETDEEFNESLEFVRKIGFADAHIFQYSPRRGTPAAARRDQIPPEIKEERSKLMIRETTKSRDAFLERFIGRIMPVLFERRAKDNMYEGKTPNYITVRVPSDADLHDTTARVLLEENSDGIMIGKII